MMLMGIGRIGVFWKSFFPRLEAMTNSILISFLEGRLAMVGTEQRIKEIRWLN